MMMSDFLTMLPPGALMMIVAAGLVLVPHHARQLVMLLAIAGSAFSPSTNVFNAPTACAGMLIFATSPGEDATLCCVEAGALVIGVY